VCPPGLGQSWAGLFGPGVGPGEKATRRPEVVSGKTTIDGPQLEHSVVREVAGHKGYGAGIIG